MEIGFHQKDLHLGNSTKLENLSKYLLKCRFDEAER